MEAQTDINLEQLDLGSLTDPSHSSMSEWIAKAQQVLMIVCVVSTVMLVYSWLAGIIHLVSIDGLIKREEKKISSRAGALSAVNAALVSEVPEIGLQNRSLFSWSLAPVSSDATGGAAVSPASAYRLVGISEGATSSDSVAMVENTKTKMTLVLSVGKNVEGLELKSIQNGKATVKIGGIEIELE